MHHIESKKSSCISEAVLNNAELQPERIAIVDRDGSRKTTWKELESLIYQIADYAMQLGINGVVPIVQGRTMEYIATVLGLNLAGVAVSPLTKDDPAERIEYIKKDLGADFIADSAFVARAKKQSAGAAAPCHTPNDIAWIIYTSASTGRPKGVVYANAAICAACADAVQANGIGEETIAASTASFSFCASLVDMYAPLFCGGTVHILSGECCRDKFSLEHYLRSHCVNYTFITPRMLSKMQLVLPDMKIIATAGEKVSGVAPRNYQIHVFYGMTESLASVTYFELDGYYENTPIGKPVHNKAVYLLDENGDLSDEGEICVSGVLAEGYWNLPELTSRTFVKNPFSDDPEHSTLLHTGDIGRRLPDGKLLFLNRNDWMVKINGHRVEPGEVEYQIKAIDGVTEAVVKGFENAHGQIYLCAWYAGDASVTEKTVKTRLASTVASYMMPAFILKMDVFPVNSNGKLDRNALAAPDASVFRSAYAAPQNDMEAALCEGFAEILGVSPIGRNDDFFALGGDSIQVVSLCAELEKYGIKSGDVFKGRTPRGIASERHVDACSKNTSYRENAESYPLTAGQTGVYFACINAPASLMYNIPFACELPPETDSERLGSAIRTVLSSFSAFGTRFQVMDGEVRMVKRPAHIDIQTLNANEADIADMARRFIRPFDIEKGELARFMLVRTRLALHLMADIHHIIFDGSSVGVFLNAVLCAYAGETIAPERISIFEAACMEQDAAQTLAYARAHAFFKTQLSEDDFDSALAPDFPATKAESGFGAAKIEKSSFNRIAGSSQIESFARRNGITEATLFMGAFAWAMAKLSGTDGVRFCTVDSGRHIAALSTTLGMLVRTLPVSVCVNEELTPAEYLRSLGARFYEIMGQDVYPFYKLSQEFGITNDTVFAYQAGMLNAFDFAGQEIELEKLDTGYALAKLSVQVHKAEEGYTVVATYRGDLYSEDTIRLLISLMKTAVAGFLKGQPLRDMPLVNRAALRQLNGFHGENVEYAPCSVVDLLRGAMEAYPEKIAVVCGETRMTYSELDDLTDRLAAYLVQRGIGKEDVVAILSDRNEMMVICPLAVLRAGAMYQPLDSSYPSDRLNYMLKDSGAKLLITPKALFRLVETDIEAFYTEEMERLPECSRTLPSPEPGDAFIVLYTSGSTGKPKGCVLEHKNVVSYIRFYSERVKLSAASRVTAYASFGFDANVMDTYPTLCSGATLYIIPFEMRLTLDALNRYMEENGITHAFFTTQIARYFVTSVQNKTLQYIGTGGETLSPCEPPRGCEFVNLYGPTEGTVAVTSFTVDRLCKSVPIGCANENTQLYVIDRYFRRVPVGMPGELCIAGPQVSRGYLHLPEKTAEVFVDNPFTEDAKYKKMYRTGDIVRFLPDGNLQFVGRKDAQVKISGFRIELAEVEEVIHRFDGIKDAAAVAFDDPAGGKFLVAYVVSDEVVNADKLNDFIRSEKPAYMVPAITVQLDAIPLTPNHKVNKKALPKPESKAENAVLPKNKTQQRIFDLTSEILGHRSFGIHTDLFNAGLSSISSVRLIFLLSKAFDRSLSVAELYEHNTVEKLERLMVSEKSEETYEIREEYPLTKAQEGIFYACMNRPKSTFYNVPYLIKLGREIETDRLKEAIADTVNAHPYLMTTLFLSDDGVRCRRDDNARFSVSDIEEMTAVSVDGLGKNLCRPFSLQGGRLLRIVLIHAADNTCLFIDVHHIIFDGTSLSLLMEDISRAYAGEVLEAEVYSGYEAALHEKMVRETTALTKAKKYYGELFADMEGGSLPLGDYPNMTGYASYACTFPRLSVSLIEQFCHGQKLTKNAVFTAAFGYLLAQYQGEEHAVFATVYNGRDDYRFANSISMFVKTIPVLCTATQTSVSAYIRATAEQMDASRRNDIYSFAEQHHDLGINADVMFVYQDYGFARETFCGERFEAVEVQIDSEKAPLAITVALKDDSVCISAEYDASRYSSAYIRLFTEAYEQVLLEMLEKETLADISPVEEKTLVLLEGFHGKEVDFAPCSVVDLLRRAMKAYPEKIAVVSGETRLTYRELDSLTDRLAAYLVQRGIGKEDVVAILSDRNEMMAICPLAVIKAGAMYQPLDSSYPSDRLTYMVKDSGAKLLITPKALRPIVQTDTDVFFVEDIKNLPQCDAVLPAPAPEDAFVILYTSGSTGNPKGCVLEHRSFAQFIRFYNSRFSVNSHSAVAAYASFGFDANVMDLFATFCAGAVLHIIPADMRLELFRLNRYFEENGITHSFMTTQMGRQFVFSMDNHSLKYLIMGGEALIPVEPPEGYTIVNGYGPTETTCGISFFDVDRLYPSVPLGRANDGVRVYVVDKHFRRVPVGVPGELCIAGGQVGRGYLNLPDKTAAVFVDNPFTDDLRYKRMYRTGDIACFMPDGKLQFVGRKDAQVKIRGFRIELTEVEEVIRRFDGIKDATVAAFDEPGGGKFLAAYVVSDKAVNTDALNEFIRSEKPAYMVPAVTMQLDAIPLTPNHKVNKKALPKPVVNRNRNYVPPRNEVEKDFCAIMGETLRLERYSAEDSFFEVGGSSILVTKVLVSALAKGYCVAYTDLFQYPSPCALAEHLSEVKHTAADATITDYDYGAIHTLLQQTDIARVDEAICRAPSLLGGKLGNMLLTGVTGFLGIHILHEYITCHAGSVVCLMRKSDHPSAEARLKFLLSFYFSDDFSEAFAQGRIRCIEANINDEDLPEKLANTEFDTVIHCAACVKHFAADDILYRVNTEGTQNILRICEKRGKRLVHISTASVSGFMQEGIGEEAFTENQLYIGQRLDNEYVRSKYLAERCILEAALRGVNVKIMRIGNLMARTGDAKFQLNYSSNGFMRDIRGAAALGYTSVDRADRKADLSPIDATAHAVMKIADADLPVCIYHVYNDHLTCAAELTDALEVCGFPMKPVSESEYRRQIALAAQRYKDDANMSDILGGLIAYKDAQTGTEPDPVDKSNVLTTQILSRLGFTWPKIDMAYLCHMLENLIGLGFFEKPEQ